MARASRTTVQNFYKFPLFYTHIGVYTCRDRQVYCLLHCKYNIMYQYTDVTLNLIKSIPTTYFYAKREQSLLLLLFYFFLYL